MNFVRLLCILSTSTMLLPASTPNDTPAKISAPPGGPALDNQQPKPGDPEYGKWILRETAARRQQQKPAAPAPAQNNNEELERLTKELAQAQKDTATALQEKNTIAQEGEALKKQIAEQRAHLDKLTKQIKELDEKNRANGLLIGASTINEQTTRETITRIQNQINDLTGQLTRSEAAARASNERCERLSASLEQLRREHTQVQANLSNTQQSLRTAQITVQNHEDNSARLARANKQLTDENQQLRTRDLQVYADKAIAERDSAIAQRQRAEHNEKTAQAHAKSCEAETQRIKTLWQQSDLGKLHAALEQEKVIAINARAAHRTSEAARDNTKSILRLSQERVAELETQVRQRWQGKAVLAIAAVTGIVGILAGGAVEGTFGGK